MAHLALKAADDLIVTRGRSSIVLSKDIAGAFAALWRKTVLPAKGGDEQFWRSLAAAGVEEDELAGLYADIVDTSFWAKQGSSQHSVEVAASLHNSTWAAVDGISGVTETIKGAAAGMILAGAFFSVGVGRPIRAFRQELRARGLLPTFEAQDSRVFFGGDDSLAVGTQEIVDVSFVDDVANAVGAPASTAIATAVTVAGLAAEVYQSMGCHLTFSVESLKFESDGQERGLQRC